MYIVHRLLRFLDTSLHSSVASEESLTLSEPRLVRTETGLRENIDAGNESI